jgi:hypothetical protein
MDVASAGAIDPEVKEGRTVSQTAKIIISGTAISNYISVGTLLAIESGCACGLVIHEEVAILADIAFTRRTGAKLATNITSTASPVSRGDNILASCSSASVDSLIAVIVASVGILLPKVIAKCARAACKIILVRTSETITMTEVADISDSQVRSASGCERVRRITCLASGQPEVKVSRTIVKDALIISLAVRVIRESLCAKEIVL